MADQAKKRLDLGSILDQVRERLLEKGVEVQVGGTDCCDGDEPKRVKVVCVAPGLSSSMREMGNAPRDQVLMVRVDAATLEAIDAWVQTGAVKSRSEAAALFLREGLKVRADELETLRGTLADVEQAKQRLREQARKIFGEDA